MEGEVRRLERLPWEGDKMPMEGDMKRLLGRELIEVDLKEISAYIKDKVVLVTGGGGSIGSELCRQIASYQPKQLLVLDIYENNAYDLQIELRERHPKLDLKIIIASVRDMHRLERIFEVYHPDVVFHAAAHKHVPLMEDNPCEAIKNNVFGTYNTVVCADKYGVEKFILISTDKAVNPTSIMGASKRICEMVIQLMNKTSNTNFVAVRFGNVLGSNGSVLPLFTRQILQGGPVTVTHPEVIRYFMTIPEAVSLVLEAATKASNGEIFILDMGEPVKIDDLARNMIRFYGLIPEKDIKIIYTGLRPGEKLYEELSLEGLQVSSNKLIYIEQPLPIDEVDFMKKLKRLREFADQDLDNIKEVITEMVPSYQMDGRDQ